ncbi:hypothetical protein O181_123874 [Austropuccinia psidii MF-1]|uniref:Uncharacterized protein n=1 Tax=Austropuccinia psidii MF-1 TaxID=1389203 RepID=A0A9Q3KNB0_9BASI|nr:hypothetical protein [Austropuccinia psidii MF-1]
MAEWLRRFPAKEKNTASSFPKDPTYYGSSHPIHWHTANADALVPAELVELRTYCQLSTLHLLDAAGVLYAL